MDLGHDGSNAGSIMDFGSRISLTHLRVVRAAPADASYSRSTALIISGIPVDGPTILAVV